MTRDQRPAEGEPLYRSFQISTRSRAGAIALAVAVVALGGVFIVFGLVLLVVLAAAGTALAAGVGLYRRLTGRWPRFLRQGEARRTALDPALEVQPGHGTSRRGTQHNERPLPPGD